MLQALFEKCADWLFPMLVGITIWFGIHYLTLAPRIIGVDQKISYESFNQDGSLPQSVGNCVKENITPVTLSIARLEAALYTATLKHIDKPFKDRASEIDSAIDSKCGLSRAREEIRRQQAPQQIKRELQNGLNMWMQILEEFR